MSTEPFLHDGPQKDQVLELRRELGHIELQIAPIEQECANSEKRMGCLFLPIQLLTFGFISPNGRLLNDLSIRRTCLRNRIKSLEAEMLTTLTPNQTKAVELNREISRAVVHELRAHCDLESYSAREFEDLVACLFQRLGWIVRQTPYTNDGGKDAVLSRGNELVFLECKHFTSGASVGMPILFFVSTSS